ncbi:MAG: HAD family hydrolase [Oscillospiraceae bacterium]|nr:HAD family hydrolase [Oscillospiraceae bacterium]
MRYRHCIFDLYGTLADIRTDERSPRLWVRMAELYRRNGAGYWPGELREGYFRLVRELEGVGPPGRDAHEAHPEIQIEQVFQGLYAQKGVEAGDGLIRRTGLAFRAHSTEYLRLYEGAAELLRLLRARGCGVWLLSNAQGLFTRWELERLGLDGLFDGVYLSSDYGCKKPDPRFFQALLQERGIDPGEAVMTGNDGVCDIKGAKAVGLAAVYIRSNLSPDEPLPDADYVLEEMDWKRAAAILTGDGGPGSHPEGHEEERR